MGSGESCEYKCTAVRASLVNFHACTLFVYFAYMRHIGEVKLRIYALGEHIHCNSNDIHVSGTLSISK